MYCNNMCIDFLMLMCSESQQGRERVIQSLEGVGLSGEGRGLSLGIHQLPVRPVTQNGKHAAVAVTTNAYGKR